MFLSENYETVTAKYVRALAASSDALKERKSATFYFPHPVQ